MTVHKMTSVKFMTRNRNSAARVLNMTHASLSPKPSDDYLIAGIRTDDSSGTRGLRGLWD
jgi:hypothetical protein